MIDPDHLIDRLVAGDADGLRALLAAAPPGRSTRDRQLVAIARATLAGEADLVDALVRDHLVDHPDGRLAAWIASRASGAYPQE